jgi:pimeloyl-ACP methyl ester carboxylesterase
VALKKWMSSLGLIMVILLQAQAARAQVGALHAAALQAAVPPFEQAACPAGIPFGYRVECGFVSVPEDRAQPGGRQIKIGVAVVHANADLPAPDPVFFLNGGPGGAIIAALPTLLRGFDPMLSVRDVVFFDQRGAGWSQPSLVCPEVEAAKAARLKRSNLSRAETLAPYLACRDRLQSAGVDLAAYNSSENAADVDDVRRALGYDQINLFGVSYGTMLAQVMLRERPDYVRSAVLDSAYPIWEYVMADAPLSLMHHLETIFTNCENDVVCRIAYPDVRAVFTQLAKQLQQQPRVIENFDPATLEVFSTTLDQNGLISWMIYNDPRRVPGLLYDLREGDYEALRQAQRALIEEAHRPSWPISEGMKMSVACSMRLFQVTPEQSADTNARYLTGEWANRSSADSMALCQQWPSHGVDEGEAVPLHTDVPLLVIGGEYDAGSPPRYAETIAAASTHGYAFIVPEAGHAALISADPCANGLVYAFLNNPLQRPESDCLANTRRSGFVLRAALTRPVVTVTSLLLLGVLAWSAWRGVEATRRRPYGWAWRISRTLAGWWPVAASAASVALALFLQPRGVSPLLPERVIETIVPLLAGVQAAFLFSPEEEPGLEVMLACPRPITWTIVERLLWLLALQGGVALIGSVVLGTQDGESAGVVIARWLAPLLFFTGLGLCLTIMSRQIIFSVGLTVLLWCGLMLASEYITQAWPWLWPLSVYAQPELADFWLNRLWVMLCGLALMRLAAVDLVRDPERVLAGRRLKKRAALTPANADRSRE